MIDSSVGCVALPHESIPSEQMKNTARAPYFQCVLYLEYLPNICDACANEAG